MVKTCCGCHLLKSEVEFNKSKVGRLGLHNHCRSCQKVARRKAYLNRREVDKARAKAYSTSDKAVAARAKLWADNKRTLGPISNARRRTEGARVKARAQRTKWMAVPHNKIAHSLRVRVRTALRSKKSRSTEQLTGCSFEELKAHLESLFLPGMSWDNHGAWHVDHRRPLASFDLTREEDQLAAFHFSNLQPLWARDNRSKGGKHSTS